MTALIARPLAMPLTVAAPRIATTVCVTTAALLSLAPSLLPRAAVVQAVLTGILVAVGWGLAALWRRASGRRTESTESGSRRRRIVAWAGAGTTVAALILAQHWQNGLRAATGAPPTGLGHWVTVVGGGAAVAAVLVAAATGLGRLGRTRTARRTAAGLVVATVATAFWLAPAAGNAVLTANATTGLSLPRPASPSVSGSDASLVSWETLGGQGRRFVSAPASASTVRTYVGLGSAPDLDSRVRLAVREVERAGGLDRSHLVVAVPTGSGWIDPNALAGFEERFGGDVAEVAVQYSAAPSWATFVFDRDSAEDSARALYSALAQRVSAMPAESRPALHLYGQSLGAIGAAAVGAPCGVLLAGPPAGRSPAPGVTVLANASDPVVHWSPRLLVAPPRLDGTRLDAPTPPWLPVVSFVQTTVDLLTSLDSAPGHGHRYGTDQGTALPTC